MLLEGIFLDTPVQATMEHFLGPTALDPFTGGCCILTLSVTFPAPSVAPRDGFSEIIAHCRALKLYK
jgi:hypothetical protein